MGVCDAISQRYETFRDYGVITLKPRDQSVARMDAWIATEVMSPNTVGSWERLAERHAGELVQVPRPLRTGSRDGHCWHLVVLGSVASNAGYALVNAVLPPVPATYSQDVGPDGHAIAAALLLTEDGRYARRSLRIAAFGWGIGRILATRDPAQLSAWADEEPKLLQSAEEWLQEASDGGPVNIRHLADLSAAIRGWLEVPSSIWSSVPAIVTTTQGRPKTPFHLTSPLLRDLIKIRKAAITRGLEPISRYVGRSAPARQWDPMTQHGRRADLLHPRRLPDTSWPSPDGEHPTLLQQLAINAIGELPPGSVLTVDGPPASGKTTLVRHAVAHALARRARLLVEIDDPEEAVRRHLAGEVELPLLEHSVVVAGHGNATPNTFAAQLCASAAARRGPPGSSSYFPEVAHALHGANPECKTASGALNLIAARLGSSTNTRTFLKCGLEGEHGLDKALSELARESGAARTNWHHARERFRKARQAVIHQQALVEAIPQLDRELGALRQQAQRFEKPLERAVREVRFSQEIARSRSCEELQAARLAKAAKDRVDHLQARRPLWLWRVLKTKRALRHAAELAEANKVSVLRIERHENAKAVAKKAALSADQAAVREQALQAALRAARYRLQAGEARLGAATKAVGSPPLPPEDRAPSAEAVLSAPYAHGTLQAARDELFDASLEVQRAFVAACAGQLRHGLIAARETLAGRDVPTAEANALWGCIFLTIPVVTTSLAAFGKLFQHIAPGTLGWVFIDDANQASPQAALGPLWRARRVVLLGDPMQIGPIPPAPEATVGAICGALGVPVSDWMPPHQSAHSLAGQISALGRPRGTKTGTRGLPLLVQYRMEEPMASICRSLAGGQGPISRVTPAPSPIRRVLGDSCWADVVEKSDGLWSQAEGNAIHRALLALGLAGIHEPDLLIAAPFGETVVRLRAWLSSSPLVLANLSPERREAWLSQRIGTIHTLPAKAAEAVILLMGGGEGMRPDLAGWATGTPQLLYSAVSRARSSFYLVGRHDRWATAGAFVTAARHIPRVRAAEWPPAEQQPLLSRSQQRAGRPETSSPLPRLD